MFIVEWLKDGQQVHQEVMLGANVEAVLAAAKTELPRICAAAGSNPDAIRIKDAASGATTIEKI
jgi:hypothetical protein